MTDSAASSTTSLHQEALGGTVSDSLAAMRVSVSQTIRLPPFSKTNPSSWFHRTEAIFRVARLADEAAKADQVLAILPEDVSNKITPWLDRQTDVIKYEDVKAKLMEAYSIPATVRAQRVLDLVNQPLGDTTPTDAWNEIQGLMLLPDVDKDGKRREISLSREIFLRRLPQEVRSQIMDADAIDMSALVRLSQGLYDATKASRATATPSTNAVDVVQPDEEVQILAVGRKMPHARNMPNTRNMPKHASHQKWCYYHRTYGKNAYKCVKPCSYPKN